MTFNGVNNQYLPAFACCSSSILELPVARVAGAAIQLAKKVTICCPLLSTAKLVVFMVAVSNVDQTRIVLSSPL